MSLALDFNALLAARGVDPRRSKLYRHTRHPRFGDLAGQRWAEGRDRFLSFATYQNAARRVYGGGVTHVAHVLGRPDRAAGHPALFLGVTEVLGPSRPFREAEPVAGDIPGEAPEDEPSIARDATPLRWLPWEDWEDLSGRLWIRRGRGAVATVQGAQAHPGPILADLGGPDPEAEVPPDRTRPLPGRRGSGDCTSWPKGAGSPAGLPAP